MSSTFRQWREGFEAESGATQAMGLQLLDCVAALVVLRASIAMLGIALMRTALSRFAAAQSDRPDAPESKDRPPARRRTNAAAAVGRTFKAALNARRER